MKIVYVVSELVAGGGERVVVELVNAAVEARHDVSLIISFPLENSPLLHRVHKNVKIHYVSTERHSVWFRYFNILRFISRNSWIHSQSILHCHLTFGEIFGAIARLWQWIFRLKGVAIVVTCHSVGMPMSLPRRWLSATIAARLDGLALMAEDNYWCAFRNNHPAVPSRVIPNGLSLERATLPQHEEIFDYRRSIGIPDDCTFVVGTIGMLRANRKPEITIQVFSQIIGQLGNKAHCVMFGSGSEYSKVKALISELGMDGQIHLPGLVTDSRLPLAAMNVFVSLNVGNLTGMAALEAAFRGVAVVGIQMRQDYSAHESDWIWSSSNLQAVALRVAALHNDSMMLISLGKQQFDYVDNNYTAAAMFRQYLTLYDAAMQRRLQTNE